MHRKWTLDRIEFDNETYEITRPAQPEAAAPDHRLAALQLGLTPAVAATPSFPSRQPIPVLPALGLAETGVGSDELGDRAAASTRRQLH